jgi:hypothetical protein
LQALSVDLKPTQNRRQGEWEKVALLSRLLRSPTKSTLLVLAAASLSGCGGGGLDMPDLRMNDLNFFPNRGQIFRSRDWGSGAAKPVPDFVSSQPVSAEDYVDAAGHCVARAASQPADVAVGTVAGDLAAGTVAPAEQALAPGGVALGMTECQVVSHAGQPGQVDIGADETGGRKVVLTYMSGPWPGIYTFSAGRLKVVDRVAQPEPAKPVKKKARAPKTASSSR